MKTPTPTHRPALWSRLSRATRQFLRRASPAEESAALEHFLSTAQDLHELEAMQRQWDRSHRGFRHHGAH